MPEQISKYPEVTLKVLEGAGAVCGKGASQDILTRCPPDQFCSLPSGEICVYGLDQIEHMTQITPEELAAAASGKAGASAFPLGAMGVVLTVTASMVVGFFIGRLWKRSGTG